MERLARTLEKVNSVVALVSGVFIVVVAVALFAGALSRYIFRSPWGWTMEWATILSFIPALLAMAYTLQIGGHINFSMVVERLQGRARRRLEFASSLVCLIVFLLLVWGAWGTFWSSSIVRGWTTPDLKVPLVLFQWALPVGFGLLSLTGLLAVIRNFVAMWSADR